MQVSITKQSRRERERPMFGWTMLCTKLMTLSVLFRMASNCSLIDSYSESYAVTSSAFPIFSIVYYVRHHFTAEGDARKRRGL